MTSNSLDRLNHQVTKQGKPFRILIVDDEEWIREVFQEFCGVTDAFEVDIASNGTEAISLACKNKYDLITLDLIMPETSGLEALAEIKRITPQVPVMIITGNATEKLINQAGVMGACKVMYKPVTLEKYISELSTALLD